MKKRKALCCALIALNLALIWGNSTLPGGVSMELSDGFLALLSQGLPALAVIGSILIRKLAHFSEFACLGLLLGWLLSPEGAFGASRRLPCWERWRPAWMKPFSALFPAGSPA